MRLRLKHADLLPAGQTRAAWASALARPGANRQPLEQWPPAGATPTGGWILTNWRQDAPYNALCPMDLNAGARSIAGCPAVAMSQILDYHRRVNGTRFSDADDYYHNYGSGNRYWIDHDYIARAFPSFPQLNAHLDLLFTGYFHGVTPDSTRVAALIFACGVAARQVYTAAGSGTFGVAQAYAAYQRFGCDSAVLLDSSDPDVYDRLAQNMMDARPAHLAVVDPAWSYGHNLVVDGYNTSGYFHLNFGWGGSYNGWYLIPSGLPAGLTVLEGVVLDILVKSCDLLDCTCDGQTDASDFTYYSECLAGPASPYTPPGCTPLDADMDTDVDLRDFRAFQLAFR